MNLKDPNWVKWTSETLPDSVKIEALIDYLWDNAPELSAHQRENWSELAIQHSKKKKLNRVLVYCYNFKAYHFLLDDKVPMAIKYFKKSAKLAAYIKDYSKLEAACNNLATVESNRGNYIETIRLYLKCRRILELLKEYDRLAILNMNISMTFMDFSDYKTADIYHYKALKIIDSKSFKHSKLSKQDISDIKLGVYENGIVLGLMQRDQERAKQLLWKGFQELKISQDSVMFCKFYEFEGVLSIQQNKYKQAIFYLEKSINISLRNDFESTNPTRYMNLAIAKMNIGQLKEAEELFKKALNFAEKKESLKEVMMIYRSMSEYYQKKMNFEIALKYIHLSNEYKDKLQNQTSTINFTRKLIQQEYKNRLDLLEKRDLKNKIKLQNTQLLIRTLTLVGCLLLMVIILIWSTNKRKVRQQEQRFLLENLSLQLNPHFIFNALNSVQRFIYIKDNSKANSFLVQFSEVIREGLQLNIQRLISFEQEFDFLRKYISIEELRLGKKITLEIEWKLNQTQHKFKLPSLLLQPLVENAIWHGFQNCENPIIKIQVKQLESFIEVLVIDNGESSTKIKMSDSQTHLGLYLTRNRIKNMYNRRIPSGFFTTKKLEPNGYEVKLLIPLIINEDE